MKSIGRKYTWINGHVYSKIDSAIVNFVWIKINSHIEAIVIDPECSDQTPITIHLNLKQVGHRKPFKFFNILAEHEEFLLLV